MSRPVGEVKTLVPRTHGLWRDRCPNDEGGWFWPCGCEIFPNYETGPSILRCYVGCNIYRLLLQLGRDEGQNLERLFQEPREGRVP